MSQVCDTCNTVTERYFIKFRDGRSFTECKVCNQPRHSAPSCVNPYSDLTLTHVHNERGEPVRVTSKRQLLEAEKRYHFKSVVANMNSENFDKPPVGDPCAGMHPADRIAKQMQEQVGRRDSRGNKLGFLFPEQATQLLKEIKEKNIDISTW